MSHNIQVDSIYVDLKKAFDKQDHDILLHKLEPVGLHGDLLRWVRSYISNRSQAVTFHGYNSTFLPVTSGVPQGIHFGLFLIYTHDLPNCLTSSQISLFADNAKLYLNINCVDDCQQLQSNINNFSSYCTINKLLINHGKCLKISFSRIKTKIDFNYIVDS